MQIVDEILKKKCKVLKNYLINAQINMNYIGAPYYLKIKNIFIVAVKNNIHIHILISKTDYYEHTGDYINYDCMYKKLNFIANSFFEIKIKIQTYGNKKFFHNQRRSKNILL